MRNWMRFGLLVLGITASATILDAPPAYAQMPVTDAGSYTILGTVQAAITGAIQTMMNNVVSKITGLQTSIQTVLTQGFTQEANYAKAQIGAQQQIADASNMANAQFRRNIRNAQVRDQHILSPQACIALDSGQSMTAASVQAAKVSAAIAQVMDARTQARPGTPAWEGQAKAMEAVTQLHLARYCDEDEQTAGLCTAAAPAQINADQDATSLFGQASYADQTAVNAANDYATEVIQPVVPAAMRGDALTSVAGQDQEARRRSYNALDTYSLGMKQMAKLAQAIVHGPQLIILDEPTNGLDPPARQRMLDMIKRDPRRRSRTGALLVAPAARRRGVLRGRPDSEGRKDRRVLRPRGRAAGERPRRRNRDARRRSRLCRSRACDRLRSRRGERSTDAADPCGFVTVADLYQIAADRGVQIRRLNYKRDSLEDIFLKAMENGHGGL